jgi:hypothetical protein
VVVGVDVKDLAVAGRQVGQRVDVLARFDHPHAERKRRRERRDEAQVLGHRRQQLRGAHEVQQRRPAGQVLLGDQVAEEGAIPVVHGLLAAPLGDHLIGLAQHLVEMGKRHRRIEGEPVLHPGVVLRDRASVLVEQLSEVIAVQLDAVAVASPVEEAVVALGEAHRVGDAELGHLVGIQTPGQRLHRAVDDRTQPGARRRSR